VKNVYTLVTSAISLYTEKSFRVTLPTRQPRQYSIPTDADVALLIQEARPDLKVAIVLGSCGLRRGEVCALKYMDILRDFSAIYIHSDMVLDKNKKWIHKDMPKTSDSVRSVELPPQVIQMLGSGDPDAYVVPSTPAAISDAFARLRNRLGLSCRFHDLRHYSVSIMHAIGIPDQYIMERHGFSSDTVLKSVYRNTLTDKSNQFTHLANDYFAHNVVDEVVIGHPTQLNGEDSESMQYIKPFMESFRRQFPDMPLIPFDERFTSTLAHRAMIDGGMRRKQRQDKAVVDKIAACILLEDYLNTL
jgi:putative transcription antitermination factor YqgF